MKRRVKLVLPTLLFGGLAVALLTAPGLGQTAPVSNFEELTTANCYSHHSQEGYRSMDLFPATVTQVAKGDTFQFQLTVQNPWLHELLGIEGFVNVSKAPGLRFPGEKDPYTADYEGTLGGVGGATTRSESFPVEANATSIVAWVEGEAGPGNGNDFDLAIQSPNGKILLESDPDTSQQGIQGERETWRAEVRVPYNNITQGGTGNWDLAITYNNLATDGGLSGAGPEAPFTAGVSVYYNLSRSEEFRVRGPDVIKPGQSHTFTFPIIAGNDPGQVELIFGAFSDAHHKHTDPNAEDHGDHTKFASTTFTIGDQTLVGNAVAVSAVLNPGPVMKGWGQVLGYAASFLLVPALVLGGTFGPGSVNGLNKLLGARRRILWHNATSFLLLGVAVIHTVLFLAESFWPWSKGIVWGSLSLACMIGLAFNGAMQRRFIARWGFSRWRFTHFGLGILMVLFVLVHLMVDGSHFQPVLKWMGLV